MSHSFILPSYICGIYEDSKSGQFFWTDNIQNNEVGRMKYFVDPDFLFGSLDSEWIIKRLLDDELYVVLYETDDNVNDRCVDFGLTKDEILDNVLRLDKYEYGAAIVTFGQMFLVTREVWEDLIKVVN